MFMFDVHVAVGFNQRVADAMRCDAMPSVGFKLSIRSSDADPDRDGDAYADAACRCDVMPYVYVETPFLGFPPFSGFWPKTNMIWNIVFFYEIFLLFFFRILENFGLGFRKGVIF